MLANGHNGETRPAAGPPGSIPNGSGAAQASILMLCWNQLELTKKCVAALRSNTPEALYELIVVDNASTDGTREYLMGLERECQNVRVVVNRENLGFVGGNNAAASLAATDNLVLLNNDTEPQPGWLEALLGTLAADPGAGAVGAKLVYPSGRLQEAGGIIFSDASGWNYGRGQDPQDPRFNFVREADYCSGACLLVRRQLFLADGGFDTRYAPAYYEDTDLCFRLRQAGWRVVYQPASVIIHHEGGTAGTDEQSGNPAPLRCWRRSLEVARVHHLADQVLHLGHVLIGHFQARAGGHLEIDGKLPGVGAREEGQAQEGVDGQAGQKHPRQSRHGPPRPLERPPHPVLVIIEQLPKHPVEPGVESFPPGTGHRRGQRRWPPAERRSALVVPFRVRSLLQEP